MEGALWLVAAVAAVAALVAIATWWASRKEQMATRRQAERRRATEQKAKRPEQDEEKARAVIAAAEQGRFFPLPPGSAAFDAEAGEEAYHTCRAEHAATHDAGSIFVTDRRVLFVAAGRRLSIAFESINRVDHPFENAFRLIDEPNHRTEVFFTDGPRETAAYILVLKQRAARRAD